MSNALSFRDQVVADMIRHMEAGTAVIQKSWKPGEYRQAPMNPTTGKPYHGMNAFWLEQRGYSDPRWLTYKQAAAIGAQVRKGEKGSPVEYWKFRETRPLLDEAGRPVLSDTGTPKMVTFELDRPRVFRAVVFNAEQIDGMAPYVAPALDPTFEPVAEAERLLAAGGVPIVHDQNDAAFYIPFRDRIHLPPKAAFTEASEYYATALHELGHATGHASRLNRDLTGPFGSGSYAREELRAEMAAYMVNTSLGLGHYPERHAGYLQNWLGALKDDRNILFQAARDAETIQQWITQPDLRPELRRSVEARISMDQQQETGVEQKEPALSSTPQTDPGQRTYLAVPFREKDLAKKAGARWDPKAQAWYAPPGVSLEGLTQWLPKADQPQLPPKGTDPMAEFAVAAAAHGLKIDGLPQMDGTWHRVPVDGDRGKDVNGAYKAHLDGRPSGLIRNYRTMGEPEKWIATGHRLDPAELDQLKAESRARHAQQDQDRQRVQQEKARLADHILAQGTPLTGGHPYLDRKQVQAHGLTRHEDGSVMVPCRDANGDLWSVQFIKDDGQKRFLKDGRTDGLMHRIEGDRSGPTVIAEGYATAASLHQASGLTVVVAFNSGNLPKVAEALHRQDPATPLVIAADDDAGTYQKIGRNPGRDAADRAAALTGATVIHPPFTAAERQQGLTDWNDFAVARGTPALTAVLRDQGIRPALAADRTPDRPLTQARRITPVLGAAPGL